MPEWRAGRLWSLALLLAAQPAFAQVQAVPPAAATTPAVSPLEARMRAMPALLAEGAAIEDAFTPAFLAAIPAEQVRAIFAALRRDGGQPRDVVRMPAVPNSNSGTVVIGYDRAQVTFDVMVDAGGLIAGLRVANVTTADDSIDRLAGDLAALPGVTGWGIYRLGGDGQPTLLHGRHTEQDRAIGSTFKLVVLAALDAEIAAGRMHWSDVVALDRESVPGSTILAWPAGAPMTLHSVATLMISVSDNRATDVLIHRLGRERIEAFARQHGGLSGPQAVPLLSTLEATVLKNPNLGAARTRWLAGDEAQRRAVLNEFAGRWTPANVDYGAFAAGPADIGSIEWFASPDSIARLLGWLAHSGSAEARAILAVNGGLPPAAASSWGYVGFKGGSEPGVIALNYLLRDGEGDGATSAYAVSMAWNNSVSPVDEARFAALAARAVALIQAAAPPSVPSPPSAPRPAP